MEGAGRSRGLHTATVNKEPRRAVTLREPARQRLAGDVTAGAGVSPARLRGIHHVREARLACAHRVRGEPRGDVTLRLPSFSHPALQAPIGWGQVRCPLVVGPLFPRRAGVATTGRLWTHRAAADCRKPGSARKPPSDLCVQYKAMRYALSSVKSEVGFRPAGVRYFSFAGGACP